MITVVVAFFESAALARRNPIITSSLGFLDFRRDQQVGIDLGLVEGAPRDPHEEEGEPGQTARHAHVRALLSLVAGARADVERQEHAEHQRDAGENSAADKEIVELLGHLV